MFQKRQKMSHIGIKSIMIPLISIKLASHPQLVAAAGGGSALLFGFCFGLFLFFS